MAVGAADAMKHVLASVPQPTLVLIVGNARRGHRQAGDKRGQGVALLLIEVQPGGNVTLIERINRLRDTRNLQAEFVGAGSHDKTLERRGLPTPAKLTDLAVAGQGHLALDSATLPCLAHGHAA